MSTSKKYIQIGILLVLLTSILSSCMGKDKEEPSDKNKPTSYEVCDASGNRYPSEEEAAKTLNAWEYGATFCPEYKMHPSWDVNQDGINDCENDNSCDDSTDYMQPRQQVVAYEVCDADGNRYPSEEEAAKTLQEGEYGATFCPEYNNNMGNTGTTTGEWNIGTLPGGVELEPSSGDSSNNDAQAIPEGEAKKLEGDTVIEENESQNTGPTWDAKTPSSTNRDKDKIGDEAMSEIEDIFGEISENAAP